VQRGRKRETKDTCMYVQAGRRSTNRCKSNFSCVLCRPGSFRGTICNWEADGSDDNLGCTFGWETDGSNDNLIKEGAHLDVAQHSLSLSLSLYMQKVMKLL